MTHLATILEQTSARGRNDDGSESAATWKAAINTSFDLDIASGDVRFRHRFLISDTGGGGKSDFAEEIQFRINGGTWTNVGAATSVRWAASSHYIDDDDTTEQMSGSRPFEGTNSAMTENNFTGSSTEPDLDSIAGGVEFECEFMLILLSADVSAGDTVNLRIRENANDLNNYISASLFDIDIINTTPARSRRAMIL